MGDLQELIHLRGIDKGEDVDMKISADGNSIIVNAVDDAVDPVQAFIREKLLHYGCDKKPLMQIRLAVEEIFVNIISYAYRPDIGKAEISCTVDEDPLCVTIQFMDSGKPFDPLAVSDPNTRLPLIKRLIGGLGIYMLK